MKPATVCIGMPVRNGENYLEQAMESLLQQTYTDFTLLISDNCSTDSTEELCRSWAGRDKRIQYIRQEHNLGATGNFNFVFQASNSKYFKWASHDDVCEPAFLERCVEVLDQREDVAWCHTASDKIDEHGQSWREILPASHRDLVRRGDQLEWAGIPRADYESDCPHKRFRGVLVGTNWCVDSYGLFRSETLGKTQLFPDCYGGEKVMLGQLSLLGKHEHIPECLFAQRIHQEASSSMTSAKEQQEFVGRFASTRLILLRGHLASVRQSPLSTLEKARCYGVVAQYVMQLRKWPAVFANAARGRGVGGESSEMLAQKESRIVL